MKKKLLSFILIIMLLFLMSGCESTNSDIQTIEKAYESMFSEVDKDNVTNNLTFTNSIDGINVYYSSSNEDVIDAKGNVKRSDKDEVVEITITFELNGQSVVKHINFTVKGIENNDNETIENVYKNLFKDVDKNNVIKDLSFPKTVDGVTIKYTSGNEDVISSDGKVTRQSEDTSVIVTLELSYNEIKVEKVVTFTVLKNEEKVDISVLQSAFDNLVNFKVACNVRYTGSDSGEYDVTYSYDDNKIFWTDDEGYEYYVIYEEDDIYGVYNDEDNNYYKTSYENDEFYWYIQYYGGFDEFLFDDLDANDFEYSNGYFVAKSDKVNSVGKLIIGDYDYEEDDESVEEVFNYVKVKVENGKVVEIITNSNYTEETSTTTSNYIYTITFKFSNYKNVKIDVPEAKEETSEINEIEDVYETEDNLSVYTGGNVTGILGKYVYITNGNQSLTLYFNNKSEVDYSTLKVGDYIEVLGVKQEYNGLVEVTNITMLNIDEEKYQLYEANDASLSDINSESMQGTIVNISDVIVKSAYAKSGTKGDYKFSVSDGTNEIVVFVKAANEEQFHDAFSSLNVNDNVNLKNFVVSWFNGVQLMAVDASIIDAASGLIASTNIITVENGTQLNDALNGVTLKIKTTDGQSDVLLSDCTIDSSTYDESVAGTYTIKITYNDLSTSVKVIVKRAPIDAFTSNDATTISDIATKNSIAVGMPSTGDVNVLVLPLAFTNKTYDTNYKDTLNKAFNGSSAETGWESLSSYYYKTSYGKLNISATILDAYNTNESYNSSLDYDSAKDITYLHDALSYYDSTIDYSKYDANNDGYIDCVYLVYLAPYSTADDSLWWAFTTMDEKSSTYDTKNSGYYMFFSYEFFNEDFRSDDNTSTSYITINTQTIIHETGHALGLDDYYDYDTSKGPTGGIGGGDMMDSNIGDHNAYSKTLLGWITPTIVINKDYEATLKSFGSSGDAIIVAKDWNNSYFGEYYIIDFYTCDGLNSASKGDQGLFSVNGVRIYHIDSTLKSTIESVFELTQYDNSYTAHKLIKLVEADGDNSIESTKNSIYGDYGSNSDLFQKGDSISLKWYDGSFASTISISDISTTATIKIAFN